MSGLGIASGLPRAKVSAYLLDAGPLVAALDEDDQHHAWARRTLDTLDAPLLTCEAVLLEAWFLARRGGGGDPVCVLELAHVLGVEVVPAWGDRTEAFLRRYADRARVADAALPALAEAETARIVVTTDREDFSVYRIHRRRAVPTLMPPV